MKKYEVVYCEGDGHYHRIRALRDIGTDVKAGDIGGKISGKQNLSQEGECWIYDDAVAADNSRVYMNAQLRKYAFVGDNAEIRGTALVTDLGVVKGSAVVCMSAVVKDMGVARDYAYLYGRAIVDGRNVCCYGKLNKRLESVEERLYHGLGIVTVEGKAVLYKKVWVTEEKGVFKSDWDRDFKYITGKISMVKDYNADPEVYCGKGIHLTSIKEFLLASMGDVVIACEVDVKDVIAIWDWKVRVKKCKTIGVVDYIGEDMV